MADKKISAVNLLPEFLKTEKNKKFLSSTIDQLIQKPQLERLDGYVGSTQTPTYNSTADIYISNGQPYQLDPGLITYDNLGTVQSTQGYDDLINEISAKGGITNDLDRLFRSDVYSYNPHIDWDKLVNYQNYFWMPSGPEPLEVLFDLNVENAIIGKTTATVTVLRADNTVEVVELSNGMVLEFGDQGVDEKYHNRSWFVEGVGTNIWLIPMDQLIISENFLTPYPDPWDEKPFDTLPFDNDRELPNLHEEYVTINRASQDLNAWSRYNRWVHKDVIRISAEVNGVVPEFGIGRAQRPIIEFRPNIKLFNFGTTGTTPVDIFDTRVTDISTIINATSATVDGVVLEEGHRIVFSQSGNNSIYEVHFVTSGINRVINLNHVETPTAGITCAVLLGNENNGTDWWFDGTEWKYAQQRTALNQAPLFDLFDENEHSYANRDFYLSNFSGNKIFSYAEGTGNIDRYLGFPLAYRNIDAIGSILFDNNLVTDSIVISELNQPTYTVSTNQGYCKIRMYDSNHTWTSDAYENAWTSTIEYPIPILTSTATGISSYFEEPLSLTNNPLNGLINQFTISELSEHFQTMMDRIAGESIDCRDYPDYTNYGIKLISNANPISFAQMFVGKKEHSVIDSIVKSGDNYNKFKLSFLNSTLSIDNQTSPSDAVDQILLNLNQNKTKVSPYYYSDMLGYGSSELINEYKVSNANNNLYPLSNDFDLDILSLRSVLVYYTSVADPTVTTQLIYEQDYKFNRNETAVEILIPLAVGDILTVKDYTDTSGCYVPVTPTKLGLYPKFQPSIYVDDTYTVPTKVIQGHDGSIVLAFNDYRDDIILELENRIFNNIKSKYRAELFDINSVIPGNFRNTDFSLTEFNEILEADFIRWAFKYSIDYVSNSFFDDVNSLTWNFAESNLLALDYVQLNGSWKSVLKWLYDTDRPHTHPWEMFGFTIKPDWWDAQYSWTNVDKRENLILAIEAGTTSTGISSVYARPEFRSINPVDIYGNLLSPEDLIINVTGESVRRSWKFGDMGPAEMAWRRSSYYPFAIQRALALVKPATYTSKLYDPSRVSLNKTNQWVYGDSTHKTFFKLDNLYINSENENLTDGYSVFVSETGQTRLQNYIESLRQDLKYADYNLFFKVNGFINKDTLQIIIDAYEPTSSAPGSILPAQNYTLKLNVGNPIKSAGISGIIVQKLNGNYVLKGYDNQQAYFTIYRPIRNIGTASITVGGKTEKCVEWAPMGTSGVTGLSVADTTSASASTGGHFYQKGQYVQYGSSFYRVKVAHQSGSTFNTDYFQKIPYLPTTGGATVQTAATFEKTTTLVPYGTSYSNIQDVYDVIIGYGRWLEEQGFIFNEYNSDLNSVLDWTLTAKEFLFWTTQNWGDSSVITLSPFADKLVYQNKVAVVDNIFDSFYEYSILRADATAYPQRDLSISRVDGVCTISTQPETDGIYFARLNLVQKEHSIIFDNTTIFGDVIYDKETGSRQRRVKLVGFRTANWNGDYFSPGFVYDTAVVRDWTKNTQYIAGNVVRFAGKYYSAIKNIDKETTFDFNKWDPLNKKPTPGLLPNFDYKISQFEDFYSLDVDNFDSGQQQMSQHLTGYTPRVYLNNIFTDPVAQYKFYQGFIREKGTQNSISKLSKATISTLNGDISYNEEWAFRLGHYGSYSSYEEIEIPLIEGTFLENPQILNFVSTLPAKSKNDLIHYVVPSDLTIKPDNYSPSTMFETTSSEDVLVLQHAGYVRLDDVTATAYNQNSLLDIANSNQLKDGDTIWIGYTGDGNWDVYRYTYNSAGIIGVFVSAPVSAITFTTQYPHNLGVGEIIGISQFNSQVNGIHVVTEVNNSKQFTVASTLELIENAPLPAPGQLYSFKSARLTNFDNLPTDQELYRLPNGTKFWIDENETKGWEVYEKINNYASSAYYNKGIPSAPQLGAAISKRKNNNVVIVGEPANYRGIQYGVVALYTKQADNTLTRTFTYRLGGSYSQPTGFGSTVVYDDKLFTSSTYGLVFAGAPLAYADQGIVKISSINSKILTEGTSTYIENPYPATETKFGSGIFVERNAKNKLTLISGANSVYAYTVSDNSGTIVVSSPTVVESTSAGTGYSISGSDSAEYIAVGGANSVNVYDKSLTNILHLSSEDYRSFGKVVHVSSDGSYLFVAAPDATNDDSSSGKVFVYKNINGDFSLDQTISNPVIGVGMNFGVSIDCTTGTDALLITSTGVNRTLPTTFDNGNLILDGGITKIRGSEIKSGSAYLYHRNGSRFVYSEELINDAVYNSPGNNYGTCAVIDDTVVLVGAPAVDNSNINSGFYKFDKINKKTDSWSLIRSKDDFTDITPLKRVCLIDTDKEQVVDYYDIFDPVKGKIPGIAEQELTYKLVSDPAIYSIGLAGTNNDTEKNWLDDHVGELWWDLSSAKYVWYEQGDLEYRKNNWGKLFPGATIDVYEWVRSTLLPSEWATQADTPAGLVDGISGQPRFPDNSVISVKQVYDNITNSFSNVYYYWVKNKVTVPNRKDRRLSAYAVGSAIANPTAYGLSFISVIDKDAIMLSNVGSTVLGTKFSLNIAQDLTTTFAPIPRHTEWLLLEEGSGINMPPLSLEKKLIDSLIGHDSKGNLVPDPTVPARVRYGIGIRPQQSMFKDRLEALRNVVEFANEILINVPVTGNYSFKNLDAQEEIPSQYLNEYDLLVEDNTALSYVSTSGFRVAVIHCDVDNTGQVSNIQIVDSGYGYGILNPVKTPLGVSLGYAGPTFVVQTHLTTFDNKATTFNRKSTSFDINGNEYARGLEISTIVNDNGEIIDATILKPGVGYSCSFTYTARPQTVVVQSDDTYNGKWTKYEFDYKTFSWNRAHTQAFNTPLYWDYVDYIDSTYNKYQVYSYVVGSQSELVDIEMFEGQYVKVNNGGNGRYIVLEKAAVGENGTWGGGYNLMYRERGTVQLSNSIWDLYNGNLAWDKGNTYDETLWDQTPDIELEYILKALKEDLFIDNLKVNWNLLFFNAVKYALTEQKMLDWAFKTSFITVTNNAGNLGQPPVYKLQNSSYYEDYIKEVKPYHTQIRKFVTNYSVLDDANMQVTALSTSLSMIVKIDRITSENETGEFSSVDLFIGNSIDNEFNLNWVPSGNKHEIIVKVNGVRLLSSEWSVYFYEEAFNGYNKKFAKLVLLNSVPDIGDTITASYNKGPDILNSTERVLAYYTATVGLYADDIGQVIKGVDYPGVEIGGQYEGIGFTNAYGGTYPSTLITGGRMAYGQKIGALGTNPSDINIDGKFGFISAFSGHAPEEVVPGHTVDSLGINVYTQGVEQSPTMFNGIIDIGISTSTQEFLLPILPPTTDSISVILNNIILEYTTDDLVEGDNLFNIDWENRLLVIPPQTSIGKLSYSIFGVGGGTTVFGFIEREVVVTDNTTLARIESFNFADVIKSVYVTVNGIATDDYALDLSAGDNGPAIVEVYNVPQEIDNVVQVWFFGESHDSFNEIRSEIFNIDGTTSSFNLTYQQGEFGDHIVEWISGPTATRLVSPTDYVINTSTNIIDIFAPINVLDKIKVVTYTDNIDTMGMLTENFVGNINRRFVMSRPALNSEYVWVTVIRSDGTTYGLVNSLDFIVLEDDLTVEISDDWTIDSSDTIEVISFKNPAHPGSVLGYRIFNDMLGGTTFTRLSIKNTTYLTQGLRSTDTEIHLADASVLSDPIPSSNIPGVVLIAGERIEFFSVDGNVLKDITRGTLGTGPVDYLDYGTKVVDQGTEQVISNMETFHVQNTFTNVLTNTYKIRKTNHTYHYPHTTATILSQGIELEDNLNPQDQLEVYYGGRQLRKSPMYIFDKTVAYDSIPINSIVGTVSSLTDLTSIVNPLINEAYINAETNQVFVYTSTRSDSTSTPGWVYSGVTHYPAEFNIINGTEQQITLNIEPMADVQLTIVKRDFAVNDGFNTIVTTGTTLPLFDSTTVIAEFLKDSPTELPVSYYYGADLTLRDEHGSPLRDQNNNILTGRT